MHVQGIFSRMRTTINIDDELVTNAMRLTGIREKTALVRAGLEALIARESARRRAPPPARGPGRHDAGRERHSPPPRRGAASPPLILVDTSVWIDHLRGG